MSTADTEAAAIVGGLDTYGDFAANPAGVVHTITVQAVESYQRAAAWPQNPSPTAAYLARLGLLLASEAGLDPGDLLREIARKTGATP